MSIFDRFENAVERGVNGAFSRVFRSGIKPVDITTAIRRAMDDSVQEVSASRIIAANHFTVYASREDLFSLEASLDVLADEFAQQATEHASNNDYSLLGPVSIEFVADSTEVAGTLKVAAENRRGAAAPATASSASPEHPIIDIDGDKWLLTEPVTVIGRGSEADIVVNDSGVSRRHLELRITPHRSDRDRPGFHQRILRRRPSHRCSKPCSDGNQIVIRTYQDPLLDAS